MHMRFGRNAGFTLAVLLATTAATSAFTQEAKPEYLEFEERAQVFDAPSGSVGAQGSVQIFGPIGSGPSVIKSFEGISQYDTAALGRNFIPPDTMGAAGKTQYMEMANGAVAVYDKATGARTSLISDVAFWGGAGQTGANGDQRVMYDANSSRWVAIGFGANVSDIQIAVSATSDALGPWQSTKFTGYAGFGFGATADYPTLAIDNNAIMIGTNNFAPTSAGGANSFRGTTLDIIPLSSLLGPGAPTTTGMVQFNTPYTAPTAANPNPPNDYSRGFAIQGVNSNDPSTTSNILAVSLTGAGLTRYDVLNSGTAGATRTAATDFIANSGYDGNGPGRQPGVATGNGRVIDTLDDRVASSVFEVNGKIYSVHTVTKTGTDHTYVRYVVLDSQTNAILDEGDIGDGVHDYYQGSLAVNPFGQVVIGYDRSGSDPTDGRITFMARSFDTVGTGQLIQRGDELTLKVSLVDDYHNGSLDGQAAAGRQRWGDYSAVSLDPEDPYTFWAIGEFAREYNDAAGGHPGGTGGSRYGTFIAEIGITPVPEPMTWVLMLAGFGLAGLAARRRRATVAI
jgi:hypothetical protein